MTDTSRNGRRTEPRSHRLIPEIASVPVEPKYVDPEERRRVRAALPKIRFSVAVDPAEVVDRP
jgi:hypothetical protein